MIEVLIVDDHSIIREGLKRILSETPDIRLAGEACDGAEAMHLVRRQRWDVLLLDINLPGQSGIEILKTVRRERPRLPVLMLSMYAETQFAVRCLRAGAAGYLTKESVPEEVVNAIRQVVRGQKYVSITVAQALASSLDDSTARPRHAALSDREFQVLQLIGSGKTVGQIAEALSLSPKTISTYRGRLLQKLGAKTSAELIHYAIQNELTDQI